MAAMLFMIAVLAAGSVLAIAVRLFVDGLGAALAWLMS
jgi:hypothetical protein